MNTNKKTDFNFLSLSEKLNCALENDRNSKFNDAELIYLNIIKDNNDSKAIYRLANLYIKLGKYDESRILLNEYVCKNQEEQINKNTILSKLDLYEYNFCRSVEISDEVLRKTSGKNTYALYNKAVSLLNLYEYDRAQEIFKRLSKGLDLSDNSYIYLIRIEIMKGNYTNALILANSHVPTSHNMRKKLNYLKYHISKMLNREYNVIVDNYSINIDETDDYRLLIFHINKHFNSMNDGDSLQFEDVKDRLSFIREIEKQMIDYELTIGKSSNSYIVDLPHTTIVGSNKSVDYAKIYTSLENNILTVHPVCVSSEFDIEGYGRIRK